MSTRSSTSRQSVFKSHQINKLFKEFYPQDGGENQLTSIWNEITSLSPYVYNESRRSLQYSQKCNSHPLTLTATHFDTIASRKKFRLTATSAHKKFVSAALDDWAVTFSKGKVQINGVSK